VEQDPAESVYFDPPDLGSLLGELYQDLLLRPIPGGEFEMGSAADDPAARQS